jgi:hypothetical protein
MAPTPPGYRLWEYFTPLTQAASPLTSPWIDASGFSQVVPGFKFTGGTSTASIEASVDGTNLDADLTTLYSAPTSGTAFSIVSPWFRFKVVQTVADATVTKIVLTSRQ